MRDIMVRAHQLAATMEGDYMARMALALRQAWAEARNAGKNLEDRLIEAGGKLWERHGKRRIYFNRLHEWYGLTYETYNTGNIRDAWVDGQRVSNNEGRGILYTLQYGKLWYDIDEGTFASRDIPERMASKIIERIKKEAA